MDGENSQGASSGPDIKKLEDDLKELKGESVVPAYTETPAEVPPIPSQDLSTLATEPQPKKSPLVGIAVLLVLVAAASAAAYFLVPKYFGTGNSPRACTTEAKICPDGTSVGRSGPNCEFTACPTFVPLSTETPLSTATASATPTATVKATSTPTSSPSATPIY